MASATRAVVKRLHDHVKRERTAWHANDQRATVRLSGDFHEQLVTALERREPCAVDLMREHLDHVLSDLRLEDMESGEVDLESVLTR